MRRRALIATGAAGAATLALAGCAGRPGPGPRDGRLLRRIGFGSCMDQRRPQPLWDTVLGAGCDLLLFGGDNVYVEQPATPASIARAYAQAAELPGLARVRAAVPHLATWDDNDYGPNDGDASFAHKQASKDAFLRFWGAPADDPRRGREGIHHAALFGPAGRRVQVILLDDRWFRSPWRRTDQRDAPGRERYLPDTDPGKTLLGEPQWAWLAQQLRAPAQLRFIVSGIQVLATGHGWESWSLLPRERQRLFDTIARTGAGGVVLLSGDRHFGAFYRETQGVPYPLAEMTASGWTHTWTGVREAGPNRLGEPYTALHFGVADIDWEQRRLALGLVGQDGAVARRLPLSFDELNVRNASA
jgi:alkaline phosphatase D